MAGGSPVVMLDGSTLSHTTPRHWSCFQMHSSCVSNQLITHNYWFTHLWNHRNVVISQLCRLLVNSYSSEDAKFSVLMNDWIVRIAVECKVNGLIICRFCAFGIFTLVLGWMSAGLHLGISVVRITLQLFRCNNATALAPPTILAAWETDVDGYYSLHNYCIGIPVTTLLSCIIHTNIAIYWGFIAVYVNFTGQAGVSIVLEENTCILLFIEAGDWFNFISASLEHS